MQHRFFLGLAAAISCAGVHAGVVFQDDFESYVGNVGSWYVNSNFDAEANRGIGLTGAANGGLQALETFLDLPSDSSGVTNRYVRAARDFTLATEGEYLLELFANNTGSGFEIYIDGTQVGARQSFATYSQLSRSLGVLGVGDHRLEIGLFQEVATADNRYTASFDDIVLSSVNGGGAVPEPQSLALVLAALAAAAALRRRASR